MPTLFVQKLYCIGFLCLGYISGIAQPTTEITPPDYIKTIQFKGNTEFATTPILKRGEAFSINFDDLTGDEADYYYQITHHNFDWSPSSLYKNEFLKGFDNIRITRYENSFNTLQLYSNYTLQIPNEDTKGLKVSGNYIITIYDSDDTPIFSRKFIVHEAISQIKTYIKRSRNLQFIETKQTAQFEINTPNEILRNTQRSVKTVVFQNHDIKQAITNLKPQYTIGDKLIYKYDQEASFWGGNEYLFFDTKDLRASTINIKNISSEELYHHHLYTDGSRADRNYTYAPDINGNFVVRKLNAQDDNTEADYTWIHFTLENYEPTNNGTFHVFGQFNNFTIDATTQLEYDKKRGVYHTQLLFKQGFYNYKYILVYPDGTIAPGITSGNFDETENEYTVIAYYSPPGARYDRCIGTGTGNSTSITN